MKYIGLIILFCLLSFRVNAQNEVPADSVRSMNMPATKNFDGFLLDMNLMKMAAPQMPKMTLDIPDASKDYSFLFRLDPNVTYSQGYSHLFSLGSSTIYSMNPFGLTGFGSSPQNLQMGSFRLKNGMRINTYGEYDKDGRKVPNPSALPWERNNFKGAFELKSANGSFGIRIEVQQGRNGPYLKRLQSRDYILK